MTLEQFILWLQGSGTEGGGIQVAVGAILSVLAEYWPWYMEADGKIKRVVMFGLCLVVPLVACIVGVWALRIQPAQPETFWQAIQGGLLAYVASQAAHLRNLGMTTKVRVRLAAASALCRLGGTPNTDAAYTILLGLAADDRLPVQARLLALDNLPSLGMPADTNQRDILGMLARGGSGCSCQRE